MHWCKLTRDTLSYTTLHYSLHLYSASLKRRTKVPYTDTVVYSHTVSFTDTVVYTDTVPQIDTVVYTDTLPFIDTLPHSDTLPRARP
jgi:hypothetical protein